MNSEFCLKSKMHKNITETNNKQSEQNIQGSHAFHSQIHFHDFVHASLVQKIE